MCVCVRGIILLNAHNFPMNFATQKQRKCMHCMQTAFLQLQWEHQIQKRIEFPSSGSTLVAVLLLCLYSKRYMAKIATNLSFWTTTEWWMVWIVKSNIKQEELAGQQQIEMRKRSHSTVNSITVHYVVNACTLRIVVWINSLRLFSLIQKQ